MRIKNNLVHCVAFPLCFIISNWSILSPYIQQCDECLTNTNNVYSEVGKIHLFFSFLGKHHILLFTWDRQNIFSTVDKSKTTTKLQPLKHTSTIVAWKSFFHFDKIYYLYGENVILPPSNS